jgi:DNA-binding winged helix-turn-helix (wHTH) protein
MKMPINVDYPDVARLIVRADPESTDPIEGRSQNHEKSLSYEVRRRSKTSSVDNFHRKLRFGPFELSKVGRVLRRDGIVIPLGARALDILIALIDRAGEVVTESDLTAKVWPDGTVEEDCLYFYLSVLRIALGDVGQKYIVNVQDRGYCLVAPVTRGAAEPKATA